MERIQNSEPSHETLLPHIWNHEEKAWTFCQRCIFQHPVGDGAVSHIPFSFLSPPPSSLRHTHSPYPRTAEGNALNQTAVTSLRLLPPIVVQFIVISHRMWHVSRHCFLPAWKSGAVMRNWPVEREGHSVVHTLDYRQLQNSLKRRFRLKTRVARTCACSSVAETFKEPKCVCVCVRARVWECALACLCSEWPRAW